MSHAGLEPKAFQRSRSRLYAAGRIADLIRADGCAEKALGPVDQWDEGLVAALNLVLGSRFPQYVTWGPEHRLFYNDAFEAVLGGRGNCLGRPFATVFPEAFDRLEPVLDAVFAGGEATYTEDCQVPLYRNGVLADTWWACGYSPIYDEAGAVGGVLAVVFETTRRLLAEQALWSSEAALRAITDLSPALLWRSNADGRLTWINQPLQAFFGLERLERVCFHDRLHPDDVSRADELRSASRARGRQYEGQLRLRGADGEYRWFLIRALQVWTGEGELAGWCGSAVDIHDWRSADDGQQQPLPPAAGEDILHDVAVAESTLMWTADVATHKVNALKTRNRAAWGLPENGDPIVWEEWVKVVHPDDRPHVLANFARVSAGETMQGKFRAEGREGAVRWYHVTAFPVCGPDGAVQRIGGFLVDVTRKADPRVYVIHPDADEQNRLTHDLSQRGFRARGFGDVGEFARVADDLMPGVVVLVSQDDFPTLIGAASVLRGNGPRLPWIVVGPFENRLNEVVQLMKRGAAGVMPAAATAEEIGRAARAALPEPPAARGPGRSSNACQKLAELNLRERQVLDGLIAGGTNKSIAQALSLSPRTVETYRAHLMDRLGVKSLAELLRLATEAGRG